VILVASSSAQLRFMCADSRAVIRILRPMESSSRMPRVLVIAEAANPEWTSVPLVGWKLVRALSETADVHFVTHLRNRDAIVRQGMIEGRDFTPIDNEAFTGRFSRLAVLLGGRSGKGWTTRTAMSSLAYYSFEIEVWRQFSGRLAAGEFDIVHRVTPLSPTSPSILAKRLTKLGVPFIIGPLNGGIPWPKNFRNVQYAEREWLSHFRWLFKILPGYRSTRKYSSAIIAGSEYTCAEMPKWSYGRCVYIPENAVDVSSIIRRTHYRMHSPFSVGFVGRLVPYKGADVLIEAASGFLKANQLKLHIVGDGPQKKSLDELVARLGVGANVEFHGWLPHVQAQQILGMCDVLALPSIREFGGGVIVEAMAQGVPAIVADYGGPSELVDESSGIKVPFVDRESLVRGFERAIHEILEKPEMLEVLGSAAQHKVVATLTWEAKAKQILEVYAAVLTKQKSLNSLGYPARLRTATKLPLKPARIST
jgi:glycosyltransferase involved in cell wall biosynthesis